MRLVQRSVLNSLYEAIIAEKTCHLYAVISRIHVSYFVQNLMIFYPSDKFKSFILLNNPLLRVVFTKNDCAKTSAETNKLTTDFARVIAV